jgi:hypothetical protein
MFLVAITGKRGAGKTTAAYGLERHGFRHMNFADPLRETVELVYGVPMSVMLDPVLKEVPLASFPYMSPREILQKVGTELFRDGIHQDTWIEAFKRRASAFSHVVCSDCRFPNEAAAVRALGGTLIKVVNPTLNRSDEASQHLSETAIDLLEPDWVIENNPHKITQRQLQKTVCEIVGVDFVA